MMDLFKIDIYIRKHSMLWWQTNLFKNYIPLNSFPCFSKRLAGDIVNHVVQIWSYQYQMDNVMMYPTNIQQNRKVFMSTWQIITLVTFPWKLYNFRKCDCCDLCLVEILMGIIHDKSALPQSETKTWYHTEDNQLYESEMTKGTDMYVCIPRGQFQYKDALPV